MSIAAFCFIILTLAYIFINYQRRKQAINSFYVVCLITKNRIQKTLGASIKILEKKKKYFNGENLNKEINFEELEKDISLINSGFCFSSSIYNIDEYFKIFGKKEIHYLFNLLNSLERLGKASSFYSDSFSKLVSCIADRKKGNLNKSYFLAKENINNLFGNAEVIKTICLQIILECDKFINTTSEQNEKN